MLPVTGRARCIRHTTQGSYGVQALRTEVNFLQALRALQMHTKVHRRSAPPRAVLKPSINSFQAHMPWRPGHFRRLPGTHTAAAAGGPRILHSPQGPTQVAGDVQLLGRVAQQARHVRRLHQHACRA